LQLRTRIDKPHDPGRVFEDEAKEGGSRAGNFLTGGTQLTATLEGQAHSAQDQGGMQERPTDLQP